MTEPTITTIKTTKLEDCYILLSYPDDPNVMLDRESLEKELTSAGISLDKVILLQGIDVKVLDKESETANLLARIAQLEMEVQQHRVIGTIIHPTIEGD